MAGRPLIITIVLAAIVLAVPMRAGEAPAKPAASMATAPANWKAAKGTISISPYHYRYGTNSIQWDWTGGDSITIDKPGLVTTGLMTSGSKVCSFQVWNGVAMPGQKMRIEFMKGDAPQFWFDFHLNFTGWRYAIRNYMHDMSRSAGPSPDFTSIRISAPEAGGGSFFFDHASLEWVCAGPTRYRDMQNVDISTWNSWVNKYTALTNVPDIPATAPTASELKDLATLRSRHVLKGKIPPNPAAVAAAAARIDALNIVEDSHGIRGKAIGNKDLEDTFPLAMDYACGTPTATASRDRMLKLIRHMLDQGFACGSGGPNGPTLFPWYSNRYSPHALALIAPALDAKTKEEVWRYLYWAYDMGDFWTKDAYSYPRNTDNVHCGISQMLLSILYLTANDAEAVRMLKGFKRHCEQFTLPSPGNTDGMKTDGCGFHHNAHFNTYMYAYSTFADTLHGLRATQFQIDLPAYERLRSLIMGMYLMSCDGPAKANGYAANSLCGRGPLMSGGGFGREGLQRFGEWGGNISGKTADPVIAQAYNRRYGTDDYAPFTPYGLGPSLDGFYQFNYSPIGIYRRANWVATIHGSVSAFWSAEIWGTDNRYGRYQGYGALEVLYHGLAKTNSGMDMVGWDWNHKPGTTTIVLPFEKLAAENTREDVKSQLNYGAGLSSRDNQSGVYACDFREQNGGAWGAKANHNPSFVWKKSWFCFADQIICLGSDIANDDKKNPTATTLFQGVLPEKSTAIIVDGKSIAAFPYCANAGATAAHWLLDAYKTGYYVHPGTEVQVSRGTQTTPPAGTGNFSKGWINHGTAPAGAGYEYVVFPNTTVAAMAAQAARHAGADKPYQVLQRDSTAHIVKWKPDGRIGYALFTNAALSDAAQGAGMVASVSRPCLLMTQATGNSHAWVTVVDPVPDVNQTEAMIVTLNCGANSLVSKDPSVTVLELSPRIRLSIDVTGPYGGRGFSLGARYRAEFVLETAAVVQPPSGPESHR